jgi:hypothetical protein
MSSSSSLKSQVGNRLVFENAADMIRAAGYEPARAILTQSFIRSEVLMSTSTSQYNLPVIVTQNQGANQFNTERRLQLTDVFVVSSIQVQAAKPASSTDAAYGLYNYGNTTIFSTSTCAAAINGVYANGFLSMLIDNNQMLPAWDLDQHFRTPITQQASVIYYSAATPIPVQDSRDGAADGVVACEPNFVLAGNFNIQFSLNTIAGMSAVETNSRWIVRTRGILAQNTSKISS